MESASDDASSEALPPHPYVTPEEQVRSLVGPFASHGVSDRIAVRLPRDLLGPHPSDRLVAALGGLDRSETPWLARFEISTISFDGADALRLLLALASGDVTTAEDPGYDVVFWSDVARLVADRCETQRFIPSLRQDSEGHLRALWRPWLQDDEALLLGALTS